MESQGGDRSHADLVAVRQHVTRYNYFSPLFRRFPLSDSDIELYEFKVANTSVSSDGKRDQDDLITLNTAYHTGGIFVDNDRYGDRIGKGLEKLSNHPDVGFVKFLGGESIRSRHVNYTFCGSDFVADIPGPTCTQLRRLAL